MPGENLLLRTLSPTALSLLKPRMRPQELRAGEVLFTAGDKVNNIYFIQAGAVSLDRAHRRADDRIRHGRPRQRGRRRGGA